MFWATNAADHKRNVNAANEACFFVIGVPSALETILHNTSAGYV
jgi:hypothetical protein